MDDWARTIVISSMRAAGCHGQGGKVERYGRGSNQQHAQ
jgi:hypothetical protein